MYFLVFILGLVFTAIFVFALNPARMGKREQAELVGTMAFTTIAIPANGVGTIGVDDWEDVIPACSIDGNPIGYCCDVVIEEFRDGVAFVRPWDLKVVSNGIDRH